MPEPLLPELTNQSTSTSFSTAGKWDARTGKYLDDLRKSLKVTPARVQINSIPDVWARPLLFEMALFDNTHALHDRIHGEWRGLLAMIALKAVKGINNLSVKPLRVELNNNPAQNTIFLDAAAKMRPRSTINPNTSFENSYVFLMHDGSRDRPIGMTSPTTLVFTSTYYFDHITNIQWFNAEHLEDPVNQLSSIEKTALSSWLNNLRFNLHSLSSAKGTDTGVLNSLTGLVDQFNEDLGVAPSPAFIPAPQGFNISPAHGIFVYIDKPAAQPPAPASPVKLISSTGRPAQPDILIVDSNLPLQWGIAPNQIHVGNKTLSDVMPAGHPNGSHTTFAGSTMTRAEVWNATEFFIDRLSAFRVPNAFPGTKDENWVNERPVDVSIILPIKEKLLSYLSPDDLISRVSFSRGAAGEITISLRLTLGDDAASRDYTVSKEYGPNDLDYLDEVPIIEVFPNFKVSNWKSYYVAYSANNKKYAFQIKPVITNQPDTFNLPVKGREAERTIWQLDEYPEALICSVAGKSIGVLLLADPLRPLSQPNSYTVGVDFGASGTSVYYGSNSADIVPLTFNNHKLTVTNITDLQKASILDFFLPEEAIEVPFLSLFRQFLNESNLQDIKPILEGHIHYYSADSESDLNKPDIYADLKWSNDSQSRLRVKALLTQICLQTAVELSSKGATSITWKFSFPTAFSLTQQGQFSAIWAQIIQRCSALTGLQFSPPVSLTESVAAAQYFRTIQSATTAMSAVFIDIGSSTSDVSVWQHDKLLWQISLRLAGRDIFHNYLLHHPEIMQKFGINTDKLTRMRSSGNDPKLWAETDAMLQEHSEEMFNQLPLHSDSPEIAKLRQHLALGLSVLIYYIGLGVNHLVAEGTFTEQMPGIYVGGNGSRMFRWLSDGNISIGAAATALFSSVFQSALEIPRNGTFNLELSGAPKQEAAYGLVCRSALTNVDGHSKAIVAGERFIRGGTEQNWNTVIDIGFFAEPVMPPVELERITYFIEAFNRFAEANLEFAAPLRWDRAAADGIRGRIATELNDIASQGVVDVEPVFIIALRNLLSRNSEM
jgi:hypothetical protein